MRLTRRVTIMLLTGIATSGVSIIGVAGILMDTAHAGAIAGTAIGSIAGIAMGAIHTYSHQHQEDTDHADSE